MAYNTTTGVWSMFIDGSDIGLTGSGARDVNAFTILSDGDILMSFVGATTIPDVGAIDDSDIVRFTPTSTGTNTAGTFSLLFDGSDVGLTSNGEDIDGMSVSPDGRLIISTIGNVSANGASGADDDTLIFTATSWGTNTAGTFAVYTDGSDVGLSTSTEDVYGVHVAADGTIYWTTRGTFAVSGLGGDGSDVFSCNNPTTGTSTACGSFTLLFDGSVEGYGGEIMDGLFIDLP